ncbi:ABC transporter permease/M1 family aminopeptidase [Nostoc parmelioides]|uniref:Peptidase n=1 Tax=Nostoc parmelioides FACHB-3921 TaxID=2692909 RepID=A0ABR8BG36_9NOSO|nr:peptidase [Nostoc parmelioides]MBD2252781.1 peptidase [Nostoc parmelioides FACHB-3921]
MQSAFSAIFKFEIFYHLRRPTFWLIAILFFTIGFTDIVAKAGPGNAFFFVNSPAEIFQVTIWYTIFGILAASAFVAETFVRDSNYRMEALILATPIRKRDYLTTRFIAAFGVTLLAFSTYIPGMLLGTIIPGLNPFALGAFRPEAYVASYGFFVLPNLFLVAAIAFAIASKTRSIIITYAGAIVLVMLYLVSLMLVGVDVIDFELYRIWAMLDPFGFYAFEEKTLTWTVFQHNNLMPSLGGTLFWNRLLWITIAVAGWMWSYHTYSMKVMEKSPVKTKVKTTKSQPININRNYSPAYSPASSLLWQQWINRAWFETNLILRGRAFILLTAFGLISLIVSAMGTRTYNYSNPSTDILIHAANIYLEYILFAIIIVYAAELFWRDRELRLQAVIDATPISNAALLLSKLTALFIIITINLLLAMVVMVGYQAINGYYNFEFTLYLQMLFVEHSPYFYLTAVLALFTQIVTRHKYAGMALAVLISLSKIPLHALGLYHNLYRFAATNDIEYSLMNGYGHLLTGHLLCSLYWAIGGAILMMLAYIIYPRGSFDQSLVKDWRRGWRNTNKKVKRALAALVFMFAGVGGWIGYNTIIVNAYKPPTSEETAAEVERRYKKYENLPMPVVTETRLNIDLYPEQRYFIAQGEYLLENRTQSPIREIHLLTFINLKIDDVKYPGLKLRSSDKKLGYHIYDLEKPLMPGEKQTMQFVTRIERPQGFRNEVDNDDIYMIYPNDVVGNGTYLYSPFILPFVGYTKMVENKKAWLRQKLNLPPLEDRMRKHDDPVGLSQGLMLTHLSWGKTDITIGTSATQTAITSGKLIKEWTQGDRKYFRYQSTTPKRGEFTIYSGRYKVYRNNNYRVPIEIYYHPPHEENVKLIATQIGEALEFYEKTFGVYPFPQVRVTEFVFYNGMVFSDAGTIGIPEVLVWKSQAQGLGKENIIDWLSYLLAQAWWDEQIMAADVAGGMTINESLSAYASSLYQRSRRTPKEQVLARKQLMRDFFRQLGKIDFKEPPLTDVYNETPIARYKGGMVLELVEDIIGKEALLSAIRDFLNKYRHKSAPYATVIDLRDAILSKAAAERREVISELFAQVITYQVSLTDAVWQNLPDGKYKIKLKVEAQKLYTSNLGEQKSAVLNIPFTVSLEDASGNRIYQQKHQVNQQQATIEVVTDELPTYAAVDGSYILPSAVLQDNVKRLRADVER